MVTSKTAHAIKHRQYANDEFMTPPKLAEALVSLIPIKIRDSVLEPCPGEGAFVKALRATKAEVYVLAGGLDFLAHTARTYQWIITNPPYSQLDRWLDHSFSVVDTGVALLLGLHNITPARLEKANEAGFGLTQIHLCKVFHWFGISAFCVWQKGKIDIVTYDRVVWR